MKSFAVLLSTLMMLTGIHSCTSGAKVRLGIEVLVGERLELISGKRIGLITNATGMTSDFRSSIDVLNEIPSVELIALFGPEHGVRGDIEGGYQVPQYTDERTGITVYSLYGQTQKPTPDMLKNIDLLLYDIQDIGSRAYTYIYTMAYAMQAAAENHIPFMVLDRPNPLGGKRVEGNVLDPRFSSFIGLYPIPFVYGLTVGELAHLFNEEFDIHCDLTVIPMSGWRRSMQFRDTGLPWVMTSPHIPQPETAVFAAATGCIGELGTVSEGVGYTVPFEVIGTPWMDGYRLADELNSRALPGVYFRPIFFRPFYMKFIKEQCSGVHIHILNHDQFSPSITQLHILHAIMALFPDHNIFDTPRISSFDKAYGTDQVRLELMKGTPAETIISSWEKSLKKYQELRTQYIIYD